MPTYTYTIGPWQWVAPSGGLPGCYTAPSGSVCVLDFRSNEQMGQPGRTDGQGLFAFSGAVPDGYAPVGVGYGPEVPATPTSRNEMQVRLGLSGPPSGDTLTQAIVSCFQDHGDPTGVSFARPIDLGPDGFIDLWLMNHSRVHRESFDPRELLATSPRGRANRLRDLVRIKLDIADDNGKLPEALGAMLLRCGYSRDEVKGGAGAKRSEWQRLLSAKTRNKYGASLVAKEPKTQLVETWPTDGVITSGQVYTWAAPNVGVWIGSQLRASGGRLVSNLGNEFYAFARCEVALSSADHWAEGICESGANLYGSGVAARISNTDVTAYFAEWGWQGRCLKKYVTNTLTILSTVTGQGSTSGQFIRCRANGSTISAVMTGFTDQTVTDTSIVGNLKGGAEVIVLAGREAMHRVRAVTLDDGLSAAKPWLYLSQQNHILGGGI